MAPTPCPFPLPARALTSLDVVSWRVVRPEDNAGSLEGGLRPDGRAFSTCDGGRSIVVAIVAARIVSCQGGGGGGGRGGRQTGTRRKT